LQQPLNIVLGNLTRKPLRSSLIASFILVLTGFLLTATMIIRGAEDSLRTGMERMGADLVVIPYDMTEQAQKEVLAGRFGTKDSMPADNVHRVRSMQAVKRASAQLYLQSLEGPPYSTSEELYVVAFDPKTDFIILPWLKQKLSGPLKMREAIGGSSMNKITPPGQISVNGYSLNLAGKLEPTGIWYDQAVFISFETARDMIAKGMVANGVSAGTVSTIAVELKPGIDRAKAGIEMVLAAPSVYPVQAPKVMTHLARQRAVLIYSLFFSLGVIWVLAIILTSFIFSLMVNEQRREIGILRAVGASRKFIFRLFLTESAILALIGGLTGIILGLFVLFLLKSWLMSSLNIQVLFPSLSGFILSTISCFLLALILVLPALLYPAIRASHLDPATAMREV
jgi:putative ABC transport system permease protein